MNPQQLIVNFGGPRNKEEIAPFLEELLTDPLVIDTPLPKNLQRILFKTIAKKRAGAVYHDYKLIGGCSPIYNETESVAKLLSIQQKVLTFHRYLPATHKDFLDSFPEGPIDVLPLFPQFSYTTTGSAAKWLHTHLKNPDRLLWIKSYATHPAYLLAMAQNIKDFLRAHALEEEKIFLLFSAHGLPKKYVQRGDPYEKECTRSYEGIMQNFPCTPSLLAYQSKFGPGTWLKPYTSEVCAHIHLWNPTKVPVVVIPLSFTSDHVETLFEVEYKYLPPLRAAGLIAKRCPALGMRPDWIEALSTIMRTSDKIPTSSLIR